MIANWDTYIEFLINLDVTDFYYERSNAIIVFTFIIVL